jgi:hypothetical protein
MQAKKNIIVSTPKKITNSQAFDKKALNTRLSKFLNPGSLPIVNDWFKNESNAVLGVFLQRLVIMGFLLAIFIPSKAQTRVLEGKVVDASNGKSVEFANLGITGTFMGDATGENGFFHLTIAPEVLENTLRVSAVGYQPKEFVISKIIDTEDLTIELVPAVYGINEVDVEAPSRVLYGMLKTVVRQFRKNYVNEPYSATMKYREKIGDGKRELKFDYTDATGYLERSRFSAFSARNYRIISGERNFEFSPLDRGMHWTEELLRFDYLRNPGNILDSAFVYYFDVYEKDNYKKDGQHIIVVGFASKEAQYVFSGDAQIKKLNGELHIVREDMSICKFVTVYHSNGRFRHGRSFFVNESLKEANNTNDIKYTVSVEYGALTGKKVLAHVKMDVEEQGGGQQTKDSSFELSFDNFVIGEKHVEKETRQYYDDVSVLSSNF